MPPSTSLHPSAISHPHQHINPYTRGCYGGGTAAAPAAHSSSSASSLNQQSSSMLNTQARSSPPSQQQQQQQQQQRPQQLQPQHVVTSPYASPQLNKKGLIRQFFNSRPALQATTTVTTPEKKVDSSPSPPLHRPAKPPLSPSPLKAVASVASVASSRSPDPPSPETIKRCDSPRPKSPPKLLAPPVTVTNVPTEEISPVQRILNRYPLNQIFLSRYNITAELGSGGFGHVLAATRTSDEKEVAVKLILKKRIPVQAWARDRELGVMPMEVYLVRRCNHPNVVAFEDFYEDERFAYLVMEMHGTQWSVTDNPFVDGAKKPEQEETEQATKRDGLTETGEKPVAVADDGQRATGLEDKVDDDKQSTSPTTARPHPHPAIARVLSEEAAPAAEAPSPASAQPVADHQHVRQTSNPGPSTEPLLPTKPTPPPMARTQSFPLPAKLHRKPSMDLFECIERNSHLPEHHARHVFRQIAQAVAYLHSRGIVHRDLKDENIVIDSNLHVKLIDFGSAAFEPAHKKSQLFDRFQGTLQYASPEILKGEKYKGRPSDIWAMGVLLYTMLYGECPFASSEEAMESGYKPPRVRTSLECLQLVDWMLEKSPDRRPTAEQVLEHIWVKKGVSS